MTYSRTSLWMSPEPDGITGDAIDAWFRARGPAGAAYVGLPYREPPAGTGQAIIDECQPYGINPVLKAAQIAHETANLQSHIVRDKNNPSGIGAVNDNAYEGAHTYATLQEGIRASVAHLMGYIAGDGPWNELSPRYELVKKDGNAGKVRTLADLEQKWAWSRPERYNATPPDQRYGGLIAAKANDLVTFARSYRPPKETPPVSKKKPIIALAAGHHNRNRGGAVGEYERVGPLTREIAKQLREHGGFDLRVITPDDGMGDFPGGLQDVAKEAVRLNADCFLEVHMEGNGAGDAGRGCFTIYPDWPPDVDDDVKYTLGPELAKRVQMLTHLPLRGSGLMSEKDTGVGRSGYRLGAFSASASARANMTRLLFEYGALTSPRDKAIIDGPEFNTYAAQATVGALVVFYGVQEPDADPRLPPKPHADARAFPQTGQWVMLGFKAFWEQFGNDQTSVEVFGYPLTPEITWESPSGAPGAIQYFERAVFEYHSDIGKVLLRRLGAEELERAS